jgi:hypothetical protein
MDEVSRRKSVPSCILASLFDCFGAVCARFSTILRRRQSHLYEFVKVFRARVQRTRCGTNASPGISGFALQFKILRELFDGFSCPKSGAGSLAQHAGIVDHDQTFGRPVADPGHFRPSRRITARPAAIPPALTVPAAGSGPCSPSCASRAPSSRDTHRRAPFAGPARCGREP